MRNTPGIVHAFGPALPDDPASMLGATRVQPAEHAAMQIIAENIAAKRFLNAVLRRSRARCGQSDPASVRNVAARFPYVSTVGRMSALIDEGSNPMMAEVATLCIASIPAHGRRNRMSLTATGRVLAVSIALLVCCCTASIAGTTGGISGRISDQLGAPIAGASV